MQTNKNHFDEAHVLHKLRHYLPAQMPLKDFIHHNTLHAFQDKKFYQGIFKAAKSFGYQVTLPLREYRKLYQEGRINEQVLDRVIRERKGSGAWTEWKTNVLSKTYDVENKSRIGHLRLHWKTDYKIDLDTLVHPLLFRILCNYLDQGIAINECPVEQNGFLSAIKDLEKNSYSSFFKAERAKSLLLNDQHDIRDLLKILVGNEAYYEQYLFDQQFCHCGWSGMVATIEDHPEAMVNRKNISLQEVVAFELLLEIDALDYKFGTIWKPVSTNLSTPPTDILGPVEHTELQEVFTIWQDAYEWSYYDQVLAGIGLEKETANEHRGRSFQAMFCIDDRECSMRRYVERFDPEAETFGTPGFFGVEFYYQPEHGKSYTKQCPAPVNPTVLIKEGHSVAKQERSVHFTKHTHSLVGGWVIAQTVGFWSAARLAMNIFRPTMMAATSSSARHMGQHSLLTIEHSSSDAVENGLQIGFTIPQMADRVEGLLKSTGLVQHFAPIVYIVGHGSTSANNTHYAGYDCGACSGRPGSVNARVAAYMANHPAVRLILAERGIVIPDTTQFVGGLHDTCRDDILFYDTDSFSAENAAYHQKNMVVFEKALDLNAKERSRRFESIDTHQSTEKIHAEIRRRSLSMFEPRPELNHATNALCIVGRRNLSKDLFLDRRSFMNSYDYRVDPEGRYLTNILNAVAPVCGGINLEYYFSRVDNHRLGAGTKLAHNVMGLFGVANGTDGDLRTGLPSQMIEVHDPVRLLVIVEHFPKVVLDAIKKSAQTYEWFVNEWIHLVVVHPETKQQLLFRDGQFDPYEPVQQEIERVSKIEVLLESHQENFPVYFIENA